MGRFFFNPDTQDVPLACFQGARDVGAADDVPRCRCVDGKEAQTLGDESVGDE